MTGRTDDRIASLAVALETAWDRATAIPAPSAAHPDMTVDEAYAVQELIIERREAAGRRVVGWKLGLTSARPPTTPIAGALLDDMVVPSGSVLSRTSMIAPLVEAELVVEIGEPLVGPVSLAELCAGPHRIGGGIEVVDYRTVGAAGPVDWVSDNGTVAYAVVGDRVPVATVVPPEIVATLSIEGRRLASGVGEMVMGNPLAAVAWLAEHLAGRGRMLGVGDVVLTGSLTGHHEVPDGHVRCAADFGSLGVVSVAIDGA